MDLYVSPAAAFTTSVANAPTGLVGTIGVRVLDGDGNAVVARTTTGIIESPAGSGLYFADLTSPASPGTYTILWDNGSVTPTSTATDALHVTASGYPDAAPSGPDLITLAEYRSIAGLDPTDTRQDAKLNALIPLASQAVASYAARDFGTTSVTEARSFEYDGSGYIDIDDAATITSVEFVVPNSSNIVLDADSWYAAPARRDDSPVFTYIVVLGSAYGTSPLMGFTRNLDVLWLEGRVPSVTRTALVTGTWGWPTVPGDVRLATAWTIQDWISKASNETLSAEAIEGYSRSWGGRNASTPSLAIPNRARDLLAAYQRLYA